MVFNFVIELYSSVRRIADILSPTHFKDEKNGFIYSSDDVLCPASGIFTAGS